MHLCSDSKRKKSVVWMCTGGEIRRRALKPIEKDTKKGDSNEKWPVDISSVPFIYCLYRYTCVQSLRQEFLENGRRNLWYKFCNRRQSDGATKTTCGPETESAEKNSKSCRQCPTMGPGRLWQKLCRGKEASGRC